MINNLLTILYINIMGCCREIVFVRIYYDLIDEGITIYYNILLHIILTSARVNKTRI